jgi:putative FmdB family regulatory protein
MPIYEYRCSTCHKKFEKIESFFAPHTCECKFCHSQAERVVSLSSFILKGTGWYVTDHPSKDRKLAASDQKSETLTPAPAPETAKSTEPKPAAVESKPTSKSESSS